MCNRFKLLMTPTAQRRERHPTRDKVDSIRKGVMASTPLKVLHFSRNLQPPEESSPSLLGRRIRTARSSNLFSKPVPRFYSEKTILAIVPYQPVLHSGRRRRQRKDGLSINRR
ncbi:hypothetical protein ACOSQ2_032509 [Xanthoceras sorbifolium]